MRGTSFAVGMILAGLLGPAGCTETEPPGEAQRPLVLFTAQELQRLEGLMADTETGTLGVSSAEIADLLRQRSADRPVDYGGFPDEEPADFWDQKARASRLELEVRHAGMLLHLFGDDRHVAEVQKGILKAAGWDRWSERDLPNADILRALAFGYDWFYDYWSPDEREVLRQAILDKGVARILEYTKCQRAADPMCDGVSPNHMASNAAALGFAALTLPDEPGADDWLELAVERMQHSLEAAGGDDGGAVEGIGYGIVHGIFATDFLQDLAVGRGIDLASGSGWLRNYPMFVAHAIGPGGKVVNFNDTNLDIPTSTGAIMLWLASRFPATPQGRVAQTIARELLARGAYLGPLGLFHLDNTVETQATDSLPLAATFESVGQVYVRSGWSDSDLLFASRSQGSGPDGNKAHTHYDAGHFVLNYGGDQLLADPGYAFQYFLIGQVPDLESACPGVEFEYLNEFTLRASGHNTLVFDWEITQLHLVDGLVRTEFPEPDTPAFFVEMEFAEAYARHTDPTTPVFDRVRRRIAGVLPYALLVHDHARSVPGGSPHSMQVLFHSQWRSSDAIGPEPAITLNGPRARIEPVDGSHVLEVMSLGDPPAALASVQHPYVTCIGDFLIGEVGPATELHAYHLLVPCSRTDAPDIEDLTTPGSYAGAKVTLGPDHVTLLISESGDGVDFPGLGRGIASLQWHIDGLDGAHLVLDK